MPLAGTVRVYVLIAILALVVMAMMGYGYYTAREIVRVYMPLINAVTVIESNMTISHLILEEVLSGDFEEDRAQVFAGIGKAEQAITRIRAHLDRHRGFLVRIDNAAITATLDRMRGDLEQLEKISEARLANAEHSGPGSPVDEYYDEIFNRLLGQSRVMEREVSTWIADDMQRFEYTRVLLAVVSVILAVVIVMLLYALQRKQRATMMTLMDANRRLAQDENELRLLTTELERQKRQLEKIVDERTAEIKTALHKAEVSSQAKSEFLSSMSHELRTPLNAILGFGQLLEAREDEFAADDRDNIREIMAAGSHLLELVNDVLDLSAIESGQLDIVAEEVPVDALLSECSAMLQAYAHKWSVSLEYLPPEGRSVTVSADRRRLKQVLLNLLSNAIKYNREHGRVTLSVAETDGGRVRIEVEDTGEGIADRYQHLVFLPFERVAHRKAAISGTGIGLTISRKLIESMGGSIGFTSRAGIGSTFWVELPRASR